MLDSELFPKVITLKLDHPFRCALRIDEDSQEVLLQDTLTLWAIAFEFSEIVRVLIDNNKIWVPPDIAGIPETIDPHCENVRVAIFELFDTPDLRIFFVREDILGILNHLCMSFEVQTED